MMRIRFAGLPDRAAGLFLAMVVSSTAIGRDGPPGRRPAAPPRQAGPAVAHRMNVDRHGDPLPRGAAVRFGTVRHRQETPIEQIVYSPDGRSVATGGDDADIRIWDGRDGRLVRRVETGPALLRAMAFLPDSRILAVASYHLDRERLGYSVDVTDADVASGTRTVRGPWPEQDSVSALALSISPGHRLLATATTGGTLRLRDAQDGRETGRFLIGRRDIRRVAFAPSGERIAALSRDEGDPRGEFRVDIFDPRNTSALRVIPHLRSATRLVFSPDGQSILIGHRGMMDCRDVGSGQEARMGRLWVGEDAAFTADGRLAASFNWPHVNLQDLSSGQNIASFECPVSQPTAWAFSPDGATVATNGGPTVLHFWDARTGRDRLATDDAHSQPVRCLLFSADGKTLVTGGDDRTVRVWDTASGSQRKVLSLAGQPRALAVSPNRRFLVAGAEDPSWVFVWDLTAEVKPTLLFERFNAEGRPLAVRTSAGDETVLAAWSDGRLLEWDRKNGKLREKKTVKALGASQFPIEETNRFRSGVFFADAGRLGVIQREKGLRVAEVASGRLLGEFEGATIVASSPDGSRLAVAVQRDDPYFEQPSWRTIGALPPHRAAPGPEGATIVLLDGESGKEKLQIPVSDAIVWGLAFSPDGKTLAATCGLGPGRARGQIRLYQVATGGQARSISTPPFSGPSLAFSPDGSRLATAMADTSVLLWDLRPGP